MSNRKRHYWHAFTHPIISEAGDNDEEVEVAEDFLGIPGDAQDAAEAIEGSPAKRQKGDFGKRGPSQVTPSPQKSMPRLHRRRYGGTRSSKGGRQPFMHGASHRAGAYNPVHYRRSRRGSYRRRKLRWGTKVRKQALGLFEGKRNVVANTDVLNRAQNSIHVVSLFSQFVNDQASAEVGKIKTARFNGRGVHIRGIKFNLWAFNKTITHPVIVRVICGWRQVYADVGSAAQGVNTLSIFRNTDTKEKARTLAETADWLRNVTWRTTKAPIDKSAFRVAKDMTFHLGPSDKEDEQNHGNAFKQLSFWWEMNNKILHTRTEIDPLDDVNTQAKKLNFYPVIMIYHCNPEVGNTVTSLVDLKYDYCVYWKDPLG